MRHWDEVKQGTYLFDRKQRLAAHLLTVTLQDCVAFFDLYIRRGGPQRRKFSSQLFGAQTKYPAVLKTQTVELGKGKARPKSPEKPGSTGSAAASGSPASSGSGAPETNANTSTSVAVPVVVISDPATFKRSMHLLPNKTFHPKVQQSPSSPSPTTAK